MEELFKEVVKLPFPMTYNQIETALHKSSPENYVCRLPEEDGGQVIGSQIPFTTFGVEFFAEENKIRLREDGIYSEVFIVSSEGFGGVVHAVYDSPDEEVIEYCKKVVQDFLVACQQKLIKDDGGVVKVLVLDFDSWRKEDIEKILKEAGCEVSEFRTGLREFDIPKDVDIVLCSLLGRTQEDGVPFWENVQVIYYFTSEVFNGLDAYFQLPRGKGWSPAEWWQKEMKEKVLKVIKRIQ